MFVSYRGTVVYHRIPPATATGRKLQTVIGKWQECEELGSTHEFDWTQLVCGVYKIPGHKLQLYKFLSGVKFYKMKFTKCLVDISTRSVNCIYIYRKPASIICDLNVKNE